MPSKTAVTTDLLLSLLYDIIAMLTEPASYKVRSEVGRGPYSEPTWITRADSSVPPLFPRSQSPKAVVYGARWTDRRVIEIEDGRIVVKNDKTVPSEFVITLGQLLASRESSDVFATTAAQFLKQGQTGGKPRPKK